MDPRTQKALDRRQEIVSRDMERLVQAALTQIASYTEIGEQGYYLGGSAVSLLVAGHLHLTQQATRALANDWLRDQLDGLAAMISGGSPELLRISLDITPRA
jgi:hypothetical protein